MSDDSTERTRKAAEEQLELAEELEVSGEASLDDDAVLRARTALHAWVDTVVGVVAMPGLGRATLIHEDGRRSSIASADLPYRLSAPVKARED